MSNISYFNVFYNEDDNNYCTIPDGDKATYEQIIEYERENEYYEREGIF